MNFVSGSSRLILAVLDKQQNSGGGKHFRDRTDPKHAVRGGGHGVFNVGEAIAFQGAGSCHLARLRWSARRHGRPRSLSLRSRQWFSRDLLSPERGRRPEGLWPGSREKIERVSFRGEMRPDKFDRTLEGMLRLFFLSPPHRPCPPPSTVIISTRPSIFLRASCMAMDWPTGTSGSAVP